MIKKYELEEVADAVKDIVLHCRMIDTYELETGLRDRGIYYEHRTFLKKLHQIEKEYDWFESYWSNGYIWYYKGRQPDLLILTIIAEKYKELLQKRLAVDGKKPYSVELTLLDELIKTIESVTGIKVADIYEDWNNK